MNDLASESMKLRYTDSFMKKDEGCKVRQRLSSLIIVEWPWIFLQLHRNASVVIWIHI